MNIDFKKGIINGVIIYVVVFMAISVLIALGLDAEGLFGKVVGLVAVAASAYFLAGKTELKDTNSAFGYGVLTAVVVLALDFLITKSFNPEFNPLDVNMLISYGLIVAAPVVENMQKK